MKKLNIFCIIIGIICLLVAGYIVTDKILVTEDNKIEISEEKELKDINNHLSKIGSPLGWLIVKEGIDSQDDNGKYSPKYNYNYLEKYENRQLFVMEYILSYQDDIDSFTVLSAGDQSVVEDTPTSDFTLAYLDYKIFNKYYKELLGEDFKITKGKMGNTKYDKDNKSGKSTLSSSGAYGVLFDGVGICSGYADAMSLFLDKLHVKNYRISSDTHVWNLVYVEGSWKHLDLTWDDPITDDGSNILEHEYLLISYDELKKKEDDEHDFDETIYKEAL